MQCSTAHSLTLHAYSLHFPTISARPYSCCSRLAIGKASPPLRRNVTKKTRVEGGSMELRPSFAARAPLDGTWLRFLRRRFVFWQLQRSKDPDPLSRMSCVLLSSSCGRVSCWWRNSTFSTLAGACRRFPTPRWVSQGKNTFHQRHPLLLSKTRSRPQGIHHDIDIDTDIGR